MDGAKIVFEPNAEVMPDYILEQVRVLSEKLYAHEQTMILKALSDIALEKLALAVSEEWDRRRSRGVNG